MTYPNIFSKDVAESVIARIDALTASTQPQWGKMQVAQMLAHCCVTYEMVYTDKHKKPGAAAQFLLKLFVKPAVVGNKPYKRNSPTAPAFVVNDTRDFEVERKRLVDYIRRVQADGEAFFDGRASNSFGKLSADEWNVMFYKHIDHHLTQFGV